MVLRIVLCLLIVAIVVGYVTGDESKPYKSLASTAVKKTRVISDTHSPRQIRLRAHGRTTDKPYSLCSFPVRHLLTVSDILIEPQTVQVGGTVKVTLLGNLKKEIKDGLVDVSVSYGIIPIKEEKARICDKLACPVGEGPFEYTEEVPIPLGTPNGKFTISYEVFNDDEERVTCVEFDLIVSS